jgi:hypothetical protein
MLLHILCGKSISFLKVKRKSTRPIKIKFTDVYVSLLLLSFFDISIIVKLKTKVKIALIVNSCLQQMSSKHMKIKKKVGCPKKFEFPEECTVQVQHKFFDNKNSL